jgi:hypothetical protein
MATNKHSTPDPSEPLTMSAFEMSLRGDSPPRGISPLLLALWHDRRGQWDAAHQVAQDVDDPDGAWVHAYLHRKEGDATNAAYWYRRAKRPIASGPLDAEWAVIVAALIAP